MQQEIQIPSLQCNVLYTIGKNSQDNFDIIDAANPNDLWFHIFGFEFGYYLKFLINFYIYIVWFDILILDIFLKPRIHLVQGMKN